MNTVYVSANVHSVSLCDYRLHTQLNHTLHCIALHCIIEQSNALVPLTPFHGGSSVIDFEASRVKQSESLGLSKPDWQSAALFATGPTKPLWAAKKRNRFGPEWRRVKARVARGATLQGGTLRLPHVHICTDYTTQILLFHAHPAKGILLSGYRDGFVLERYQKWALQRVGGPRVAPCTGQAFASEVRTLDLHQALHQALEPCKYHGMVIFIAKTSGKLVLVYVSIFNYIYIDSQV